MKLCGYVLVCTFSIGLVSVPTYPSVAYISEPCIRVKLHVRTRTFTFIPLLDGAKKEHPLRDEVQTNRFHSLLIQP